MVLLCISVSHIYAINDGSNFNVTIQQDVSGIVTDDAGIPLPGVTVIIKGTTKGAATDFDGIYTLQAADGDILEFSYVGFKTQSVTVGSEAKL